MNDADAPNVRLFPLLAIRRAMIAHEQAFLERRFGVAYTEYKTKVSGWL